MRIIVDGFGGDHAPLEIIKGCVQAQKDFNVEIVVTGHKGKIELVSKTAGLDITGLEIVDCPDVIDVEEDPVELLKGKKNSSMAVGFSLLKQGKGDIFLTAGSTGAFVVGGNLLIKRIKGIKRAGLAPIIPAENGCYILNDAGANLDCRPEMLYQFGLMGDIYMREILGIKNPRVGLLNIGQEETKGSVLQLETFKLLKEGDLNFIGNVEARDVPLGKADVVVCDGFSGNVVLKLTEGVGKLMSMNIKRIFTKNIVSKLSALLIKNSLDDFKKKMDYTEYGGAPLLGVCKPVIKAHGSSNAKSIRSAIEKAMKFVDNEVIPKIENNIKTN